MPIILNLWLFFLLSHYYGVLIPISVEIIKHTQKCYLPGVQLWKNFLRSLSVHSKLFYNKLHCVICCLRRFNKLFLTYFDILFFLYLPSFFYRETNLKRVSLATNLLQFGTGHYLVRFFLLRFNKLMSVFFVCVCPRIDDKLCHNIVKVAVEPQAADEWFRSKRIRKLMSICFFL